MEIKFGEKWIPLGTMGIELMVELVEDGNGSAAGFGEHGGFDTIGYRRYLVVVGIVVLDFSRSSSDRGFSFVPVGV